MNNPPIPSALAPMAGYTDYPMRKIAAQFGASYVVSEMISSVAMCMNDRKTAVLAKIGEGEAPVILQLFGHDPSMMAEAARKLLTGDYAGCSYAAPPAGIDINMGCPVKKIVTSGDGSALMRTPDIARAVVAATAEVCAKHNVPLSVKIRAGWDSDHINCAEFAADMAQAGADKITIHCRTREQMYMPSADPSHAESVAQALKNLEKPVILAGNGDIETRADAERYLAIGCGEVAVGRAALGNPWIFRELSAPATFVPPTVEEIKELAISLVEAVVREHGETVGVRESRARAAYFIKGMRGAARVRERLNHAETLSEFVKTLETIGEE